ncbi:hypothetical protein KM043_002343 [Ampulex compressa]|nr:hypothetical protein KM043_002343 [Ampulex compressa]
MRVTNALIVVLCLSGITLAANEFVLHRCIATVELIRRHRKNEPTGVKLSKANEGLHVSSVARKEELETPVKTVASVAQVESNATDSNRVNRTRVDIDPPRRSETGVRNDTPLKTVSIQAVRKDRPPIFRRKVPLPELERDILGRKIDASPNVIIIKPVVS